MNSSFLLTAALALLAGPTGALAQNGPVTIVNLTNGPSSSPVPPPIAAAPAPSAPAADPAPKPAATPEKNTSSTDPAPTAAAPSTPAPAPAATPSPAATTAPAAKTGGSILDKFISDLSDAAKLSDDEKKEIQAYYQADGATLQKVLNDASLSPLQQADQVADLRDQRDAKIDALLQDPVRQHEFYEVEANYRVALTEFAADGGLAPAAAAPAAPPPAAPAPAVAPTGTK